MRPIRIKQEPSVSLSAPSRASSYVSAPSRASSDVSTPSQKSMPLPVYGWFVIDGDKNCNYIEREYGNSINIERAYKNNPEEIFREGGYEIRFGVCRWWNKDCQAIEINNYSKKERPLIRQRL